jgi:endonuclease G
VTGSLTREDDPFAPDPLLKPGRRAELKDYARTGYDRGHQSPAADETVDKRLKDETFFLSNMAPQKPALNRKIWKDLEGTVRDWAESRGEVYIITGGMFYDPKEETAATASGTVQFKVIGPDAVAVPTHFFKIVIAKDPKGVWQSIAFMLENKAYPTPPEGQHYHFENYIKSIAWIEQRAGLNFMPELDPVEEKRLERTASPMWN